MRTILHGNAENRRRSIFGTSKNGVPTNLTSNSDSPSVIYLKTGQYQFFITWKCRKPPTFYFWNIKKRRYTKSDIRFGFLDPKLPQLVVLLLFTTSKPVFLFIKISKFYRKSNRCHFRTRLIIRLDPSG